MSTFILVHGTFSPKAAFTIAGSELRRAIQKLSPDTSSDLKIYAIRWSGANTFAGREEGAKKIATRIRNIPEPKGEIFLIGHSHGGNAICYFLKEYPELAESVAGCAFLSTPFVAMRLRSYWAEIAKSIFYIMSAFIALLFAILAGVVWALVIEWASKSTDVPGIFGYLAVVVTQLYSTQPVLRLIVSAIAFYSMTIFGCVYIYNRFWVRSLRALKTRLRRAVLNLQTVDLPRGNHLFIRATGDEAAAALAAGQSLAWMSHRLFFAITTWLNSLVQLVELLWRNWLGKVVLLFLGFDFFAVFAYFLEPGHRISYFMGAILSPNIVLGIEIWLTNSWSQVLLVLHELFFQPVLTFVLLSLTVVMSLLLFVTVTSIIVSLAFGWTGALDAIFIEFAVEPVPVGATTLHHVRWPERRSEALMHSFTYSNESALEQLSLWVLKSRS